ncbi:DUF3578 domain-containing protein [Mucilaginibacter sp. JRF]|uniref:MrcB family domain-containing protein n=1 Tax=Mucilaginibacter sp. JRF TaxID=2780088 RepID=UPI0018828DBF|nr:DUF3578 domain-containing protein [Mucilaginibacter sp. JRF]MBE9583891.1 DUF3578 domain-containing protein [Mucilaginibacter sp. JRF]
MKEFFQDLLNDYQEAYGQKFADHPVAKLVTKQLPDIIKESLLNNERYVVKGSAGKGRWSANPWVAIFDILITQTAQSGYYPVFLFKEDMSGFYLSLNQGVTEIKNKYKRDAKQVLKMRAEDFRAQIGLQSGVFNLHDIKLRSNNSVSSDLAKLYEAGNIIAKYYSIYKLPEDVGLQADINEMIRVYEHLSYNEGLPSFQAEIENDEEFKGIEDIRRFRFHKRIERNIQLSQKVKKIQGYICKACGFDFKKKYGALGANFIEAHHLKPLAKLTGSKVELDARLDFVVLCSNCHSMIHKLDDPSKLDDLKQLIISSNKY